MGYRMNMSHMVHIPVRVRRVNSCQVSYSLAQPVDRQSACAHCGKEPRGAQRRGSPPAPCVMLWLTGGVCLWVTRHMGVCFREAQLGRHCWPLCPFFFFLLGRRWERRFCPARCLSGSGQDTDLINCKVTLPLGQQIHSIFRD